MGFTLTKYELRINFSLISPLDSCEFMLKDVFFTLENHCTRTAQSSRGSCSRRVHKIEYLTVNKGNILVNVLKY